MSRFFDVMSINYRVVDTDEPLFDARGESVNAKLDDVDPIIWLWSFTPRSEIGESVAAEVSRAWERALASPPRRLPVARAD